MERHLRGIGLAGFALAAGLMTTAAQHAAAQDMKSPRISQVLVDWEDAGAELGAIEALKPTDTPAEQLASLSRATGERLAGMIGWPVTGGLEADFPGIKRLFLENRVRYTFVRYGVPYAVSIDCFDGGARFRMISCRDADKVAVRLIKALRVAGGTPAQPADKLEPSTIERPATLSTVFTYHSPGDLLPGTGFKGKTGVADYTVYSKIRFPMADAPAFANSQSFMNWGNCDATGRSGAGMLGRVAAYRCRVN